MPSFAEAMYSRDYSWEDLAFDTPISPSTPPELTWDNSSDDEFGPATPTPKTKLSPSPDGSVYSCRPFWKASVDTGDISETPLSKNNRRQTGCIPSNLPSIEHVLCDVDISEDRGRRKARRYLNARPAKQSRSPVSPDRFIPQREFANPPSISFRVSKNPRELSPDEKLLRRRSKRADPFRPTRRMRSISPRRGAQHIRSPHYIPHLVDDSAIAGSIHIQGTRGSGRQVSFGAVWNVGGRSAAQGSQPAVAVPDGNGGLLSSGTTAPMHIAEFFSRPTLPEVPERHESRLAVALEIDPASRLLNTCNLSPPSESISSPSPGHDRFSPSVWKDGAWIRTDGDQGSKAATRDYKKAVPTQPFRILDAPDLRDDFYCSLLAYSATTGYLAVGLGHHVFLWNEALAKLRAPLREQHPSNHVTSLSFSSEDGEKSILAVGRRGRTLTLWSPFDTANVRFEIEHPYPITCVSFKPTHSRRISQKFDFEVDVEDLVVGDEFGNVWYYSVEWPDNSVRDRYYWNGALTLLAKISAHTQSVCGFSWSPDDIYLATGGNDNSCLLFDLREIIPSQEPQEARCESRSSCHSQQSQDTTRCQSALSCDSSQTTVRHIFSGRRLISHLIPSWIQARFSPLASPVLNYTTNVISGDQTAFVPLNSHTRRFFHSAAVKAIAFAPWQPSLLATGGGTNDRTIRFFHTPSGSCLATIDVHSQVTSLIWSNTHREIVATFGFARPDHPIRIAVFAWPSCEQIAAIPWGPGGTSWDGVTNNEFVECGRALYAIRYPGCPRYLTTEEQEKCSLDTSRPVTPNVMSRDGSTVLCPRLRTPVEPKAKEGGLWCSRTLKEGCIIVASTDKTVKFHEVWGATGKTTDDSSPLGGSPLLEEFEGVETLGDEVIH